MRYLRIDDFCTALARKASAIDSNIRDAENITARQAKQLFLQSSRGPYKQKTLTAMGHPYGRKKSSRIMLTVANIDPTIINIQSGNFLRRWGVNKCKKSGNKLLTQVLNSSVEAKYMLGTKRMVPRRIDLRVAKQITAFRINRARIALRAGLRA